MTDRGPAIVVHAGALGDSVLLWPMLRSMTARGERVTLVTHDSKGRLAARFLGVAWESIEGASWTRLWTGVRAHPETRAEIRRVISFVADGPRGTWAPSAGAMFPCAAVEIIDDRLDRNLAIRLAEREGGGGLQVPVRRSPAGAVLIHVGAGSEQKRWPMTSWEHVVKEVGAPARVIAGEVERERFSSADRCVFERLGGRFIDDLDTLADELLAARLFAGCDSGPAHLAAQLGLPTVALFTATSPKEWGPIGPAVRTVGGGGRSVATSEVLDAIRGP